LVRRGDDMAVVTVATFTIKPDRMEDYLENTRKAKAIFEKFGARNCRLLSAVVAGEATGSLAFIAESDDFAAQSALRENAMADPEMPRTVNTSAGPIASAHVAIWVDIPL
jgi:hypothetical protein